MFALLLRYLANLFLKYSSGSRVLRFDVYFLFDLSAEAMVM